MQFYLAFPLIYLAVRRGPFIGVCIALAITAAALTAGYTAGVAAGVLTAFREPSLLIFKLQFFLVGMLLYEGRRHAVVGVALLLPAFLHYGAMAAITVVMACMIAWFWHGNPPVWLRQVTRWRLTTFLSDCSYAVYLFHGFVLTLLGSRLLVSLVNAGVGRTVAVWLMTLAVLAVIYPLAWCVYRLVEVPGIAAGKRIAHRRAPRQAAVSADQAADAAAMTSSAGSVSAIQPPPSTRSPA